MLLWNELCATKTHTLLIVKVPDFYFKSNSHSRKTESLLIKTKARCLHTDNTQFMFAAAAVTK